MSALDLIIVVASLAAVVAAPFMLVGWSNMLGRRKEERTIPLKSTLFFAVPVLVALLMGGIGTLIAQAQVNDFLHSASDRCTISVDGHPVQNREEILNTLRQISDLPAHHSSPMRIFDVAISDPPRQLLLEVARDSSDPHEYWIFVPSPTKLAFKGRSKRDIGHVRTTIFDGY